MTAPPISSTNIADGSSQVGFQAQFVRIDNRKYYVPPNASPAKRYRVGVEFLDGGVPAKAQELIYEAITDGHASSEVWFHWFLALLSGRTRQQVTQEDVAQLHAARGHLPMQPEDEWTRGLKVILQLIDAVTKPENDIRLAVKELDELNSHQRYPILRHLDMFLKGPIEDELWKRDLARVRQQQRANDRENRVWKFFQPTPAKPRVRPPRPVSTTAADRIRALLSSATFAVAAGYLGWLLITSGRVAGVIAYLIGTGAGCLVAVTGLIWRDRVERLRAKQRDFHIPRQRGTPAPQHGFAAKVDQLFDRYFTKYAPTNASQATWLAETAAIRRFLRDEIVEVYRESRVKADEVAWLVRYRVRETRKGWLNSTLFDYREHLRVPAVVKVGCVLGIVALVPASFVVFAAALVTRPLAATAATALAAASSVFAGKLWMRHALEYRRYTAELAESRERLTASMAEYTRWRARLADTPDDAEMATWLDCDRKILTDRAMQHYELTRSAVIAHAYLEAPAASCRRARVWGGPWRYSRYQLVVFLLTTDGVRQFSADLAFSKGTFHNPQRLNYRFDAVAAVQVTETDDHRRTFELTLVNSQSIKTQVTESSTDLSEPDEDPETLSKVALDASGLTHTLHVLEGIAAEGKKWITHENRRKDDWSTQFTSAIHDLRD